MDFTRFRSKGSLTATEKGYKLKYFPQTCPGSWGPETESAWSNSDPRLGRLQTISDTVTPGYHKARKNGSWLGVNFLHTTTREITSSGAGGHVLHHPTIQPCGTPQAYEQIQANGKIMFGLMKQLNASYSSSNALDGSVAEDLVTEVVTRTMANRQSGSANLVETLAEMDQTWAMVNTPLGNMSKFCEEFSKSQRYRELERLRKKYPGRRMNSRPLRKGKSSTATYNELLQLNALWTSEYLRYRYGISPIISDVQAGLKALKKVYDAKAVPIIHTARANGSVQKSLSTNIDSNPAVQTSHNVNRLDTHSFSVRGYWHDLYAATPFSEMGLTFHNAVALPWELTRLSFVLDWFVNVGDLIYANIPRAGVSAKGGGYSCKTELINVWSHIGFNNRNPTVEYLTGSWGDRITISYKELLRRSIDPQRHTGLVVKSDFRLTQWTRAADLVAIVFQQLRKVSF